MNPNDPILIALQQQIAALTARLDLLDHTNAVPRSVEDALTERLAFLNAVGTGAAGATTNYIAFPVVVPANPSGTVTVTIKGVTYNLLYK